MAINVVSFSSSGGAGNVAQALVDGFEKIGLEANLLSATNSNLWTKPLAKPLVTLSASLDQFVLRSKQFDPSISLLRDKNSTLLEQLPSSELNIFRWMNGLLGEKFLRENDQLGNLVWGLDDMNPFTGACHYSVSCREFSSSCSACPAVRPTFRRLVINNLQRKKDFLSLHKPKYVAPTDWIYGEFNRSSLAQDAESKKILNPLPSKFFDTKSSLRPFSKTMRVAVVAANLEDPTKGVLSTLEILNKISGNRNFDLTLIGRSSSWLRRAIPKANFMGPLSSNSVLAQLREHDLLLVPSLHENAGTVLAEAASQGIPSIARNVGGMPEMTNYGSTGYIFQDDSHLEEIFESITKTDLTKKGSLAREWAQRLKPELIATEYAKEFLG